MTTSIPTPTPSLNPASAPGAASMLDAYSSSASSPSPGQPGADFADYLATPQTANPARGAGASGRAQASATSPENTAIAAVASSVATVGLRFPAPSINSTGKTTKISTKGDSSQPASSAISRDAVETVAALLAPVLQSLQPTVPVTVVPTTTALSGDAAQNAEISSGTGGASGVAGAQLSGNTAASLQAVIDFGSSFPEVTVNFPGNGATPGQMPQSAEALKQAVTEALSKALAKAGIQLAPAKTAGATSASISSEDAADSADATPAISLTFNLPPIAGGAQAVQNFSTDAVQANAAETGLGEGVAKIAAGERRDSNTAFSNKSATEKNFLNIKDKGVSDSQSSTGISVAKPVDNMSATFTARRNAANLPDTVLPMALRESAAPGGSLQNPSVPTEAASTPAPAVAHRAVETVMNVLEAQTNNTTPGGVVNLNFKFGGEDLAVRVQLRGGEVHTQFNTDSTELRSALSNEWRAVTAQGNPTGLRLVEPVFGSSSSNSNSGFGSAPQGQFSSQQNPQQQMPASAMFSGPRSLRSSANAASVEAAANSPRHPVMLPTSLHLAAVA